MIEWPGGYLPCTQGQTIRAMCLTNIVSLQHFSVKETSGTEEAFEAGEVATPRSKVPTSKDYLYLFRSLLSCDTMKVKHS